MSKFAVGVDSGGTFTDIVLLDREQGTVRHRKIPSQQAGTAYVDSVRELLDGAQSSVEMMIHGSTVAINTLIQRKGAKTGILTTRGFRDLLKAARSNRPGPHDLSWDPPEPLVPRRNILPITERLDPEGEVVEPLDEQEVRHAAQVLRKRGIEAIAICFLHSFANPQHEQRAAEIVREEWPTAFVSVSHEVDPDIREFERLSTTVVNSYVGPGFKDHVFSMSDAVHREGLSKSVFIAHSGGGVLRAENAASLPCWVLMGGPAAGVVGASTLGRSAGLDNIVTFDMGGTSCDVSLVRGGSPQIVDQYNPEMTLPVRRPTTDIVSIGAGGGSIAWIDSGGILRVGPASAGANPGPAAYGRGGENATVTDALLALGYLDADNFLGGAMRVDVSKSEAALERLAAPLGWKIPETAWAIAQIATHNMVDALRLVSVKRGHDPREFALVPYGGAGPTFAGWVAEQIGIDKVVVPAHPGLFSAQGLLELDFRYDLKQILYRPVSGTTPEEISEILGGLRDEATRQLEEDGVARDDMVFEERLEMRYTGQVFTLLDVDASAENPGTQDQWRAAFTERHRQEYGYVLPSEVQIAIARVTASRRTTAPSHLSSNGAGGEPVQRAERDVYLRGEQQSRVAIFDRARLGAGDVGVGPAIIEQSDTTTVVPEGWGVAVEGTNLVLTRAQQ